jgi:hypothetical protein
MNSYSCIRSVIRTSVCVAALLAALVSFGAVAGRQQVQAQVLDHAEFLCANCLFGASDYYYCFAADNNKLLIGYQRTRVLNWQDQSKNYLTIARPEWAVWTAPGQTVPISYDDKHIWVSRADGKQVRLTRSPLRDIFLNNDRCRDADKAKAN